MNIFRHTLLAVTTLVASLAPISVSSAHVWTPSISMISAALDAQEDKRMLDLSVFGSVHRVRHYSNGRMDSSGSASCIGITSKYYVFLTNQHVAQGLGHDVRIEMFVDGRKSGRIKGEVIYAKNNNTPHDVAVVIIPRQDDMVPTPVKLALDWKPEVDELILDFGCSTARAPRMRLGRIIGHDSSTFRYTPPAWPGDSGSPVLDPTGKWQIGITTWNDGRSSPTWGKAQIISVAAKIVKDNWRHSDPEVAAIFDAEARTDGLFRRPPTQSEEFRGFFRRLLSGQELNAGLFANLFHSLEQARSERDAYQQELTGLFQRMRENRLLWEKRMMELDRERYEMERELEEKYGKRFDRQEEELKGLRGMLARIIKFIEWAIYIGIFVGFFWLCSMLFGAGFLGKAIAMVIKGVRSSIKAVTESLKKPV